MEAAAAESLAGGIRRLAGTSPRWKPGGRQTGGLRSCGVALLLSNSVQIATAVRLAERGSIRSMPGGTEYSYTVKVIIRGYGSHITGFGHIQGL